MTGRWAAGLLLMLLLSGAAVAQDTSGGFFVEVEVDNPTPYVGEAVRYTLHLYAAGILPNNPRYVPPTFAGFWQDEPVEETPRAETRDGRRFDVYTIHTRLFPLQSGSLTIEPGELRVRAGGFEPLVLRGQPVTLAVQPPPAGQPDTFSGAVGQYEVQAALDSTGGRVGEPLTLTYTVRGIGNLEQTTPPPLDLPPGWRAYERPAAYRPWTGSTPDEKTFTWLIIPANAGSVTFNPPAWVYLDPTSGIYQTASAPPFAVEIAPGSALPNAADQSPAVPARSSAAIKPVPESFGAATSQPEADFWLLWLLPPVLMLLIGGVVGGWRRLRSSQRTTLSLPQLRRARHGDAAAVEHLLLTYFAQRLRLPPDSVRVDDLPDLLRAHHVPDDLRAQVLDCLAAAQARRFAPTPDVSSEHLISQARSVVRALNKDWEVPG